MSRASSASGMLISACASLAVTAGPAAAHTGLVDSSPADGASVPSAPRQVSLRFSERIDPAQVALVVTGPDGRERSAGQPSVTGSEVVQPLDQVARDGDGAVRVVYRVVSTDGHPVQGQFVFRVVTSALEAGVPAQPVAGPANRAAGTRPALVAAATATDVVPPEGPASTSFAAAAGLLLAMIVLVLSRHRASRTRGGRRA